MIGQIATIKLLVLIGYAFLIAVLFRSRVAVRLKLHFGLYLFGLGIWQLTSFMVTISPTAAQGLLWYNLQVAAGGLQSIIFLPLTRVFLNRRRYRFIDYVSYAASAVAVSVGLLQLAIHQVVVGSAGYYIPVFGAAAAATFLVAYLFWISGVVLLVHGLIKEPLRLQRTRIGYVVAGALTVIVGTSTDFTPLQAYPIDTVAILVNAILVSYAMTRYQLVDIGTALRRGLVVMVMGALGVSGHIVLSFAASLVVPGPRSIGLSASGLAGFLILLCLVAFFGWRSLRPILDRLAGIRTVSRQRGLEQFSNSAHTILDAEELKRLLVETATTTVGAEGGFTVCHDGEGDRYSVEHRLGSTPAYFTELPHDALREFVHVLQDRGSLLWSQELLVNPGLAYLRSTCERFFRATGVSIAVPLIHDDRLVAVLCLGERSGEKIYGPDDLQFLSTLANIAVSSITVAESYKRIQRQLSIQTFLFVLSESLVHNVGTGGAIRSAIEVLCSFLNIDQSYVIEMTTSGEAKIHSREGLSLTHEQSLREIAERLASEKRRDSAQASPPGAHSAEGFEVRGSCADLVRSLEYHPLVSDDECVGFLVLPTRSEGTSDGDWVAVSGTIRAILAHALLSVRHVAELRALKLYNDKLLESLSSIGEMMFVLDSEGTILRINDAVSLALDYWNGEIVGRPFRSFVAQDADDSRSGHFLEEALTRAVQNQVIEIVSKEDERVPLLVSAAHMPETDDSPREIVIVGRDVSERKRLQEQLLHAQKMESIGTMAGGIAHDFNNILTAAMGFLQVIRDELDSPDRAREHLEIVETSMRRAADLTQRLLSFSRAGVVERKLVSLNELISELVLLLRRSFDLAIEIETDCPADLPPIVGDRSQIHQLIMNLCVNARDAMTDGGILSLRTSLADNGPVAAGGAPGSAATTYVRLEIADTGDGIAPEDLSRIFDPFFTTKEVGKGTGLGLSIVYGIVQNHNGMISVFSEKGSGTRFEILFPVAEAEWARDIPVPAAHQRSRGAGTILVVDDEEPLRRLLRVVLEKSGYRVLEAADGVEAVRVFEERSEEVDLVLIDLIMPNLGGRDTYLRLKEIEPQLKALVATGYGTDERTNELMSKGVLGIIRKPYRIDELESEIRSAFDIS